MDKRQQERLLRVTTLTLEKVVNACQNAELTRQQAKAMQNGSTNRDTNVDQVNKYKSFNSHERSGKIEKPDYISKCKFCSFSHKR